VSIEHSEIEEAEIIKAFLIDASGRKGQKQQP
jgi:hypothetical protein